MRRPVAVCGIGAGGRATFEDTAACAGAVDFTTRLVIGSLFGSLLGSACFGSALFVSTGRVGSGGASGSMRRAASGGRGRGNGLAINGAGAGILVTVPNIGDG